MWMLQWSNKGICAHHLQTPLHFFVIVPVALGFHIKSTHIAVICIYTHLSLSVTRQSQNGRIKWDDLSSNEEQPCWCQKTNFMRIKTYVSNSLVAGQNFIGFELMSKTLTQNVGKEGALLESIDNIGFGMERQRSRNLRTCHPKAN